MRRPHIPAEELQNIQSGPRDGVASNNGEKRIPVKPRIVPSIIRIPRPKTPVEGVQS